MADKEVTVFVVDISESMATEDPSTYSGTALEWVLEYVWDKLAVKIMAARKTDYVAVLAVGSAQTDHAMGDEEAYEHIRVILPFPKRGSEDLKAYTFSKSHVDVLMAELHPSKITAGDLLSAVIIGIQMITDFCGKLKFKKNLILLTRGELMTDFTDAEAVSEQIIQQEINFSVLGVDFNDVEYGVKEEDKSSVKETNETSFRKLCEATQGIFATYAEVAASLATPRIKPVRPVTTFRGPLTIGDPSKYENAINISVERYPKTKQAKVPSASKFSAAAETRSIMMHASQGHRMMDDADEQITSTHQVMPSRTYKLQGGEELPDATQLEKGYAYGQTVVPISKADEDFLQFETAVGLQILGFVDASSFARYMAMGESSIIVGRKADDEAALALSSIIHALFESDTYAVARLVRKDNAVPAMVLLAPNIEAEFESLLEVALPFAEDVRQYKFAPLDRIRTSRGDIVEQHRYLPSKKLSAAMDKYLDQLDLDGKHDDDASDEQESAELLPPEECFSYGIHRVTQAIVFRAFHSVNQPIPKASDVLLQSSKIPEQVRTRAEGSLESLKTAADVKKVPPRTANKRKRGQEQEAPVKTGLDVDALLGAGLANGGDVSDEDLANASHGNGNVAAIGQAHPAQDFANMVKDDSLIDAAFQQIQPVLIEMVQYSLGNQTYQNTIEAFKVFRVHAIAQEESELYNTFLERFRKKMEEEDRQDFLQLMVERKIGEITQEEATAT